MIGDEGFKAAQEIAKTTHKAIDASDKAVNYLAKTFADAIQQLAAAATDSATGFRIRNCASVARKTEAHLERLGFGKEFFRIENRLAIPLIDALSDESDDGIQDIWALYIANAVGRANESIGITRIITDVIRKLEPSDKLILDHLFKFDLAEPREEPVKLSVSEFNVSAEVLNFSLARFVSIGLFSCDNSGSTLLAASGIKKAPCKIEIYTSIGEFSSLPLLLMFKQSLAKL